MENLISKSNLLASIPGLRHGFTNRLSPKAEVETLDSRTATGKQVHKADLIWVETIEKKSREADAISTVQPGLPVGVYSADCTPILIAAVDVSTNKIYAVMAVHAGWRSTAQGIARKSFREFASRAKLLTKNPLHFFAAIGPCISYESFEVGEDVIQSFPGAIEKGLARFLRLDGEKRKYLFDLPGENRRQLEEAATETGSSLKLDMLGLCTLKLEKEFPSYRRDREKAGRILSFLEFVE